MFKRIRQRLKDMRVMTVLCQAAERHAHAGGHKEPGAEHFVLAALELPDGTARRAFERIEVDPGGFRNAIAEQYQEALRNAGIDLPLHLTTDDDTTPRAPGAGLYEAQPSGKALVQQLVAQRKSDLDVPLLGAHVVIAAIAARHGVAVRALRVMGIDFQRLADAAAAEVKASR